MDEYGQDPWLDEETGEEVEETDPAEYLPMPGGFSRREGMGGRPTKMVGARVKVLLRAFERGHGPTTACAMAGIAYRTFHYWIKRGEAEQEDRSSAFSQLFHAVNIARARGVDKLLIEADKPENLTPRMIIFRLQHADPLQFGATNTVNLNTKKTTHTITEVRVPIGLYPAGLRQLADMLEKPALPDPNARPVSETDIGPEIDMLDPFDENDMLPPSEPGPNGGQVIDARYRTGPA